MGSVGRLAVPVNLSLVRGELTERRFASRQAIGTRMRTFLALALLLGLALCLSGAEVKQEVNKVENELDEDEDQIEGTKDESELDEDEDQVEGKKDESELDEDEDQVEGK